MSMDAEALLKGRMAETLVEELLRASGNTVYRFGYEQALPNLDQIGKGFKRNTEVGERIRAIPDLIVIDVEGRPSFVEVKFRWTPTGPLHQNTIDALKRTEKYWKARVVFVNCVKKPYFRVMEPPYFKGRGIRTQPLLSVDEWRVDPSLYGEFERLTLKYFNATLK